jgi:dihydrofolate synthase/folylpolyglutamate synthase
MDAPGSMKRLLSQLGNPEEKLQFIHVTGTNGKGSFCAMMAQMQQAVGKKVGLFTSPYILRFCERIQCNGEMIPEEDLARLVERVMPAVEAVERAGTPINEFMIVTAIGMLWFYEQRCDVVVLEVGIGGFHDATNCIPAPLLSVVMGIGLDHTGILGSTVEAIALDKSGIIKGNPTVLYPEQADEATAVIMERCARTGAQLTIPSLSELQILEENFDGTRFSWGGQVFDLSLVGRHQVKNAVTAITAGRMLGLPESAIRAGLQKAYLPVRMEVISRDPLVILDGAHNVHGMTALRDSVLPLKGERPLYLVLGMMRDKDLEHTLDILTPYARQVFALTVDYARAAFADEIVSTIRKCPSVRAYDDWKEGLRAACDAAKRDGALLLCCGSLFLASDARHFFLGEK